MNETKIVRVLKKQICSNIINNQDKNNKRRRKEMHYEL